jgi:hypothetical protein
MADTFEADLQAWVDAQPEGAIDPDKYAAAAARIGKKYGIEDTPENRTYFRDFAVKEYSSPGESVWQAARADPVMRSAAPSFSETQSVPLAEGYQQANLDMLARMPRGSTDPEAYATAREDLDRKYGYAVTPEQHKAYVDWASKYYNDQSRGLNVSVPDPTAPLTGVDYARNQIIADPMGAALASYANARRFGGTELLLDLGARYGLNAPGQMDALSEANPYTAMAGDALGMVGAANQLGRIGADLAGRYAPMLLRGGRGADGLRMAAVDAAYGGARGAVTSPEDPLMGAVEGAAEFGLPTFGLQAAGSALGRLAPRGFGRDGVAPVAEAPEVTNRLYNESIFRPEYKFGDTLPRYGYRNVTNPAELDALWESGYMLPPEGRTSKYFTMSDLEEPTPANRGVKPVLRVRSENIPQGRAVSAQDVELWDDALGAWTPFMLRKARGGLAVRKAA